MHERAHMKIMTGLKEALPYLVLDLESALVHIGRGDVSDQLRHATIERWIYDEIADTVYLHLRVPQTAGAVDDGNPGEPRGETVSVYDELGINLDTDSRGRLTGIEILDGRSIIAQLDQVAAISPRSP